MKIGDIEFDDPQLLDEEGMEWKEIGAVYVILDKARSVIDVGETDNLKERLGGHNRFDCWRDNVEGDIYVAALIEDDQDTRIEIETKIRKEYDPVCGEE